MTAYNGIEKYIFADVYAFFIKYKDMQNEEYYWESCIKDSNLIIFKYKNHPLAVQLVIATIDQLKHIVCNRDINGLSHEQWEKELEIAHKINQIKK